MSLTSTQLETLTAILSYRRPYKSRTVRAFTRLFVDSLPGSYRDGFGNTRVSIGDSAVLWSCHTDTVHREGGRQDLAVDRLTKTIRLHDIERKPKRRTCLGADNGAGVFLLREMILAGIPGHYVFHVGEEVGGIGSSAIARAYDIPPGIQYAIAFDRRGTCDVITHQFGDRTASDAFARSMARQLKGVAVYRPHEGVYTDTAEYSGFVPECSNVSVGYYREHSTDEYLDYAHLGRLLSALLRFDESRLVCKRDPYAPDPDDYSRREKDALEAYAAYRDERYRVCDVCYEDKQKCVCSADDIAFMRYLKGC